MPVFLTSQAQKQYSRLSISDQQKIKKKLKSLELDAFRVKKLTGEFIGLRSLRSWPHRIIYLIDNARREVWITSILHRQRMYK